MSRIDDLYKRAFKAGEYEYEDSAWDDMKDLLDRELPVSESAVSTGSAWGVKSLALVLLAGLGLINTSSDPDLFVPPVSTVALAETKTVEDVTRKETARNNAKSDVQVAAIDQKLALVPVASNNQPKSILPEKNLNSIRAVGSNSNATIVSTQQLRSVDNIHTMSGRSGGMIPTQTSGKVVPISYAAANIHVFDPDLAEVEMTDTPEDEPVVSVPPVVSSLVLMEPKELPLIQPSFALMDREVKSGKLKFRSPISPQFTVAFAVGFDQLANDQTLNVHVDEDIKNVGLFNGTNEAWNAGVEFGLNWKGLILSSGLKYRQHAASYKIFYSNSRTWTETYVNNHTQMFRDSTILDFVLEEVEKNGEVSLVITDTIFRYDTAFAHHSDTIVQNFRDDKNMDERFSIQMHYVNIPVNVGYEFRMKRAFILAQAGIDINVLAYANGNIYNPVTNSIERVDYRSQMNQVVYNAHASLGLGYDLSPNWSIMAQPRILQSLNSPFKASSNLETTYTGYGLNLSMRYRF